ncbi:MAG: YaaA family protein [Acholeplasmataceae bacterium]
MIIMISPAKTFKESAISFDQIPYFINESNELNKKLKVLNQRTIIKKMKVSEKLAQQIYDDYQHFGNHQSAAIFSYDGYQYKNLNIESIYPLYQSNIKNHLYIISGLYGLLNAFDDISKYRLEIKDKTIGNLYDFWKPKILDYIQSKFKDETIINLCSNEYGQIIKDLKQTITIDFYKRKNNQLSIHSMEVKRLRGLYTKSLLINPNQDLTMMNIDNYLYNHNLSDQNHMVFIKEAN